LESIFAHPFSNSDWPKRDIIIHLWMREKSHEIIELAFAMGRSAAVPHSGGGRQPERGRAAFATRPTDDEPPYA